MEKDHGRREKILTVLGNIMWLIINIIAVVGIVATNKLVFSRHDFKFGTLLTVIHFIFTSLCLETAKLTGLVQRKSVSWWKVIPLSTAFCGFVVLTNLSLQYNTVGFYQMAKVMNTPIMATIQFAFYAKRFNRKILACLSVICVGVCLATATELKLTWLGFGIAFAACVVTSIYSILVETEQKRLGLSSMQLLSYQAPISAAILVGFVPLFDNYHVILSYRPTYMALATILSSALLAFLVNVSSFMIIGRMSALTYNVSGHAKLCFIMAMGYLFFDNTFHWLNLVGAIVAIGGVIGYSVVKLRESSNAHKSDSFDKVDYSAIPVRLINAVADCEESKDQESATENLKPNNNNNNYINTSSKRSLLLSTVPNTAKVHIGDVTHSKVFPKTVREDAAF